MDEERNEREVPQVRCDRVGMPFCCGVDVLGNFSGGYTKNDFRKPAEELAVRFPGVLMATTVPWQKDAIKKLQELGFTPVAKFWNAVHRREVPPKGNQVTVWIKGREDGNLEILEVPR